MKLNDSYLCTDCDEVFSYKEQYYFVTNHHPICPICGNKNVLNIGRVLNRKEEKDEAYFDYNAVHGGGVSDSKLIIKDISDSCRKPETKPIETSGNQERIRRSRRENFECGVVGKQTNGLVRATSAVVDVLGKLFQATSGVKKVLSRIDANSSKQKSDTP
jgi:hypothetical protein